MILNKRNLYHIFIEFIFKQVFHYKNAKNFQKYLMRHGIKNIIITNRMIIFNFLFVI